jgi:hypothetical protein
MTQTEGKTWNAGKSLEEMNRQYIEGYRIDNQRLYSVHPTGFHFDAGLHLKAPSETAAGGV